MQEWSKSRNSTCIWHNGPIDDSMLEAVNNIIQSFENSEESKKNIEKSNQIDFIVNSDGGYIEPAYQAIRLLDRSYPNKPINFIVPRYAKSAATLIACGCDKVLFSSVGELGPLDVQIQRGQSRISGITINRLIENELKGPDSHPNMNEWIYRTLKPEEVLEMKRFNEVAVVYLKDLLPRRMLKGKKELSEIDKIIGRLCQELPSHGFVIDYEFAKNKLHFNTEYVTRSEEIMLANMRELWDYGMRLEKLNLLNSENRTLKNMLSESIGDEYE